jgi:hypothetical protein
MDGEFQKCLTGNHKWETIQWVRAGGNIDEVVRWCRVCGCIVVDQESDGRLVGQETPITGPKVYTLYRKTSRYIDDMNTAKKEIGK